MTEFLWYLDRAAGLVSLVLLTATVVLGMVTAGRAAPVGAPAFVRAAVHRSISLIMVVGIAVHVITAIVEQYVDIGWISALVPFTSGYERFWVGLGTLSVDLLLIITITSLLRERIPARAWKLVHLSAYAMWPIALLHGLGTSTTDTVAIWSVSAACLAVVVGTGLWRAGHETLDARRRRAAAEVSWR